MWRDDDTQAAIEYQSYLDDICSGCGHRRSECMDPANSDRYLSFEGTCYACEAKERAMARNRPKQGDEPKHGKYYGAREARGG